MLRRADRSPRRVAARGALALLALATSACSVSGASSLTADVHPTVVAATPRTTPQIGTVPGLPAFYSLTGTAGQLTGALPGRLVREAPVVADGIFGHVERVAYVSSDLRGNPTVVTGLVYLPEQSAPPGGYPVVAWAHATNGMGSRCAPSLDPTAAVPDVNTYLLRGWAVVAPDYQGEGTSGLLPYLVGGVAARNTLDIVRAAEHLPEGHLSSDVVVAGHSEGGQTALFALDIAGAYAPELSLRGVVAEAPVAQLDQLTTDLLSTSFRYYVLMAVAGFHAAYGSAAPLASVLTPLGQQVAATVGDGCEADIALRTDAAPAAALFRAPPATVSTWRPLLDSNDAMNFTQPAAAPLLLVQGALDEQIPAGVSAAVGIHECLLGQDTGRWVYPGVDHGRIVAAASEDVDRWMAARLAGVPTSVPLHPGAGVAVAACRR